MAAINPGIMQCIKKFGRNQTRITRFEIVPLVKKRGAESYFYYDFKVEIDGNEMKFEALSTGQKSLALISIVLNVINMSSSALSLMILDEIDNCGLDKENMHVILKAIVNVAASSKVLFINRDDETIQYVIEAGKEKGMEIPVHLME
jgi:DNA repair exonuclease SbcCD ATPase subunit